MKFFIYYFNNSEFNLENSDILYFGAYIYQSNESTTTNQNSLIVMTDFIHYILKEDKLKGSYELLKKNIFCFC